MKTNIGIDDGLYTISNGLVMAEGKEVVALMKEFSTLFYFASLPLWEAYITRGETS